MRNLLKILGTVLFAVAATAHAAGETDYPVRPIRLIVPYPPGAGTDGTARIVAEALGKQLGQSIVIENKPGASGVIGTDYVAKSPPDGYTLLWTSTDSMAAVPALRTTMPYKVPDDFTYIAKIAETGMSLVVSTKIPVRSIPEFVAYAKANPGSELRQFGRRRLAAPCDAAVREIRGHHDGARPLQRRGAGADRFAGRPIDFALLTPITIVPFMESDKMRVIGITAPARHPMLPNAPTVNEEGFAQATATVWYGLFGPARMPAAVVDRLRKDAAIVAELPVVKEKLAAAGLQMSLLFGDDFARSATGEFSQWQALGKAEGIILDYKRRPKVPSTRLWPAVSGLLSVTEMSDSFRKTPVVPAQAGTQRRSSNDTGFPLSRERRYPGSVRY